MTTITLLEKEYGSFSSQALETTLLSMCKGLRANIRVQGKTTRDWIRIEIKGEDESVALKLLDREIGLAPVSADEVGRFSAVRGKVIDSEKSAIELHVDVGVFSPRVCEAVIPLQRLQAQLVDGKNLPLQRIITLFCLHDFVPLYVKIITDLKRKSWWNAELSEKQLSRFSDWLSSSLDRLIVLGASRSEVEEAAKRTGHFRDLVKIDPLGALEHVIICKLGTDAVGLIPKFGPHLRRASFVPFSPRRIKEEVKL